jgi:hypothetical protein
MDELHKIAILKLKPILGDSRTLISLKPMIKEDYNPI